MNDIERAWVAGLLEGEGCFLWAADRGTVSAAQVTCRMTDEDVVRRLCTVTGEGSVTGPYMDARRRKPIWTWNAYGAGAIRVMLAVRPLMGQRRGERIDQVAAEWHVAWALGRGAHGAVHKVVDNHVLVG